MTVGNWGTFALSFISMDWGTFHGTRRANTDAGFVETAEFSPSDWALGFSYARRISNQFAFGGHLKYVHENLGSTVEGAMAKPKDYTAEMNLMAFDFGTLYYTGFKDLRFGMSLQNFSQEKVYRAEPFPLPLTFRFGLAMDALGLFMEQPDHSLTLAVDALHPRDYSERLHVGGEYSFKKMFFLRGGYKTNYDEEGLAFGAGVLLEISRMAVGIDYSYLQFAHFDAVQMFSFDFKF